MTLRPFLALLLICLAAVTRPVWSADPSVATTWRLLDYIAVDYRGAVQDGAVVSQSEFDEMLEFSSAAAAAIAALPESAGSSELEQRAARLQQTIRDKAAPEEVATEARALAALLVQHYPIPLAPTTPPQYERGKALYAQLCANCHGTGGAGDGPASKGLDPPPINFTDRIRADERSVAALYQVISQGLDGTSMVSYASLPAEDRWALATYVGSLAYPETQVEKGRAVLAGSSPRVPFSLERYVTETPAALGTELGNEKAESITAYLRRHPEATRPQDLQSSLATARTLLNDVMSDYKAGDATGAKDKALAAYLDGFEPAEPLLSARDNALMVKIETAMARVRTSIASNVSPDELIAQINAVDTLLGDAEQLLSEQQLSSASSFIAAFTILLREGLEALLIVVAMIALLRKAERTEALLWIHAGWTAALIAGVVTWGLATWVITISGASREMTEGFGSLLAAIVLVWVGIWMHGKSHADSWQRYVREKLSYALGKKSGLFLLILAFVVVYREVFETILFYAAIWNQGARTSLVAGAGTAALSLAVIAWTMLRYSRRLPISQFFRYSSLLIAVLAVVLIGKSVSALQEAGYLPITWFDQGLRIELLGLYPTLQGIAAQVVTALLLVVGFRMSNRSTSPVAKANSDNHG